MRLLLMLRNIGFILFLFISILLAQESLFEQGLNLYKAKDYLGAKSLFLDAIKEDYNNGMAYYYLGLCCKNLNDIDSAIFAIKRAMELMPKNFALYNELSRLYIDKKQYKEAMNIVIYALKIEPKNPKLFETLGIIYYKTKDYQKAIKAYEESFNLDSENPYIYNYIGLVYMDMKEYEKAVVAFQFAIAMKDDVHFFHSNLGLCYEMLKEYKKAAEEYEKTLQLAPDNKNAKQRLEKVKKELKRKR